MQFALHAGRLARTVGTDGTKMRKIISYGELRSSRLLARKPTRKPGPVPHTPEADLHRRRQLTRGCLTHVDHEIRHRGRYEPGRSVRLDLRSAGRAEAWAGLTCRVFSRLLAFLASLVALVALGDRGAQFLQVG